MGRVVGYPRDTEASLEDYLPYLEGGVLRYL